MTTPGPRATGSRPGGRFVREVPEGDDRPRLVCSDCGFVRYENPKIVVGSVAAWEDLILLCRRAIEPRKGFWTLPAGYLELHESAKEGAEREAWEEARARLEVDQLLAVYSIPRISQIQLIYRARLLSPEVSPGPETAELGLFAWREIPWEAIAFPSVGWALNDYRELRGQAIFAPRANPPGATGDVGGR
ncbi:MAG: NUDIX domain-containing protein [Kiloniellaceae bacterium]